MTDAGRKYAGMITRAQPWHTGHQRYLEQMAAEGLQPVIFLGTSNADRNRDSNPFTTDERIAIIRRAAEQVHYPDGAPVAPIFVPVYDFERGPHEKPFFEDGEKLVPLNRKWFAQFTRFFDENGIDPNDFTLFYAAKGKDKKNYIFSSYEMPTMSGRVIARNEDLSYAFGLLGVTRREIPLTEENATDIRAEFEGRQHFLVPGCDRLIREILDVERRKNAEYDDRYISDESFAADPLQVLRHERRIRLDHLHKSPHDPGFHKRVLLVGTEGALSPAIIDALLAAGHDIVLSSSKDGDAWEVAKNWPEARVSRIKVDLRDPHTEDPVFWSNLFTVDRIDAVINLAGIISEKPEQGLTFDAINYRAVPAMAQGCIDCGIDRYIYFSTLTAASWEAEENARQTGKPLTYAGSKRKAELALAAVADRLNSFSIRPVTTYDPQSADWGRPMTLPDLANLPVVPIWGSGKQEMQPVNIDDLAKIARLIESDEQGARILNAVGPESLSLEAILRTLRLLKSDFSGVHIPYDRALKLADNYPFGGINRAFIKVMEKREDPVPHIDSKPWRNAIGEVYLTTMYEAYSRAAAGELPTPHPPVREYAAQIAKKPEEFYALLRDAHADATLIDSVRAVFEKLATGEEPEISPIEAEALLKNVIEALGGPEDPFELTPP
ncbi:MAG TPA: NAD-dependent epimerase/dehydratase family protein [Patescibacteria group bacterium]|nr:NAD-dependent epimerase/dehydratase family protein [Patescibacteria group bacterium]